MVLKKLPDTGTTESSDLVFVWFDSNSLVVYFGVFSVGSSSLVISDMKVLTAFSCGGIFILFSFSLFIVQYRYYMNKMVMSHFGAHLSLFYISIM